MKRSIRFGSTLLGLLVAAMLGLVLVAPVQAATISWAGPSLNGAWNTTDTNWVGASGATLWAAQGNSALFDTAGNTANVSGTVYADVVQLNSSGNAVNVTGGATVNQATGNAKLYIAGTGHTSSADGNSVTVSTPGSVGSSIYSYYVYGSSASTWVGGDGSTNATGGPTYSYDSLMINNGAYFRSGGGSGTTNSYIGANGGSNYNSMTVRGVNGSDRSTFSTNGQRLYVGGYGSYNTMTVDQGGQALLRVLHVGAGGNNNTLTVDGSGSAGASFVRATEDVKIGDVNGGYVGAFNGVIVSAGGSFTSESRGTNNEFSLAVGTENGSNDNYLLVTGTGSLWTANKKSVVLGGAGTPSLVTPKPTALRNHIDIYNGATAAINTGVIVSGGSSAFNLGNGGTSTSLASVGVGTGVVTGISLTVADARLNVDNGRLTALVGGTLVSGTGQVKLNGPAYFSTAFASSIDSVIDGTVVGTLIKEGIGTLTLSQVNTYLGDTLVDGGILSITQYGTSGILADASAVKIASLAIMDLNFTGIDTVGAVWLGGTNMGGGTFNATTQPTYFTGGGSLYVVPEPATMAFVVLGGLGLLARRRRRA
jgi:fibronectin-binding autotransporter adhesin